MTASPRRLEDDLRALWADTCERRSARQLQEAMRAGAWVYGAGGYGQTIRALLDGAGIRCRGFVDARASDPAFAAGLSAAVISPDRFSVDNARDAVLIVGIFNFATDLAPIARWAAALPFRDVLWPPELPDVLGPGAASYWLAGREQTRARVCDWQVLVDRVADTQSAELVAALARYRVSGDLAHHPAASLERQYNPADLPLPSGPVTFVDGGAYTGDTYEALVGQGVEIAEWIAFEPDLQNVAALARVAGRARARTTILPCGLGDACRWVSFDQGRGAASRVDEGGEASVGVVALDEILFGVRPTFVKLDVEGFEAQALDGMRTMLATHRPRLAISLYHHPDDIWQLPAKVLDFMPGARLYVRQHGFNGFDTVLYAVP